VEASGRTFRRTIEQLPPADVVAEIAAKVDAKHMEQTLMEEGLRKFADPQKALLASVAEKRAALANVG
jgi:transaldolase